MQSAKVALSLTSTQRKSSRCSRNDFTGPPSSSSGGSGEKSAMKNDDGKQRNQMTFVSAGGVAAGFCAVVLAGGNFCGADGGEVSPEFWISSVTALVAFLNSLMPLPKPLASSGIFLAPNKINTTARIRTTSIP